MHIMFSVLFLYKKCKSDKLEIKNAVNIDFLTLKYENNKYWQLIVLES